MKKAEILKRVTAKAQQAYMEKKVRNSDITFTLEVWLRFLKEVFDEINAKKTKGGD